MYHRLTAVALLILGVGALVETRRHTEAAIPMTAENGATYLVEPGETLGSAMKRDPVFAATPVQSEAEQGSCVPEPMEEKPEGAVACRCYEHTHCEGNESHQCKRHCRKDLCQCCDI
jgi:hypothetical protein